MSREDMFERQYDDNGGRCLSCGDARTHSRGLCKLCYDRARYQGTLTTYPACGAVPVPYLGWNGPSWAEHPSIPTGFVPLRAHCGVRPDRHTIIVNGWDWQAVVREAEAFAAAYLAARRHREAA